MLVGAGNGPPFVEVALVPGPVTMGPGVELGLAELLEVVVARGCPSCPGVALSEPHATANAALNIPIPRRRQRLDEKRPVSMARNGSM
jgi:hypothetical protein